MKSLNKILFAAALSAVTCSTISNVSAQLVQPFTQGNLVVDRQGNGSAALSSSVANPIFIDQYTTGGALVSSEMLPTNGVNSILNVGSATEGFISLNPNGTNLVLVGYNWSLTSTNPAGAASTVAPRCVATVDFNANYNLITDSITAFSGSNIRSGTTDGGTNYWANGGVIGVFYMGTAPTNYISTTVANERTIQEIGGNLYYSTGSGSTRGVYEITGTPISGANTAVSLINNGGSASPYGFAFDPGMTTCYLADSTTFSTSATIGGIEKWTNSTVSPGTWGFAYSLAPGTGNGAAAVAVDWTTTPATIYATTASGTYLVKVQDSGAGTIATTNATAAANTQFRGVIFAPTNATVVAMPPTLTGISPTNLTVNIAGTATFTLSGYSGSPVASNLWYVVAGGTTNLMTNGVQSSGSTVFGATTGTLKFTNAQPSDTASYFAILTNSSGSVTSSVVTLKVVANPTISGISPANVTNNAGSQVTFTLTSSPGSPAASNLWYKVTTNPAATNLISNGVQSSGSVVSGATTTALTISNVLGGDTAKYFAILTNSSGSATSSVVSLTITNDPNITQQPNSAYGLLDGPVQFKVSVIATSPSFQWYYSDSSGNITGQVSDGVTTASGVAVVSGSSTSTLIISNLQYADATNFVVVVTNVYGSATSSVAQLISVGTTNMILAYWNFNQLNFPSNLDNPAPWFGVGTAFSVGTCYDPGTSPFAGSVDSGDSIGFNGPAYNSPTNYSWGTDDYPTNTGVPANDLNKSSGVQFNVSTVGAKDINVSFDVRATGTASGYIRLQYTTNGTTWIDYPTSTTFIGYTASAYLPTPPAYSFVGFPGVDNNPNFGIRVVTEFQSTATYGIGTTNDYIGDGNAYGTAGTITYDRVFFSGNAITNLSATPPTITSIADTNMVDTTPLALNFSVGSLDMPASDLTVTAVALNPSTVNPSLNTVLVSDGTGSNYTLNISFPSPIPDPIDAGPIELTVTDTNGYSATTWFLLTVQSINLPPTNTFSGLTATNILANHSITIPFTVGDDRTPVSQLTNFVVTSDNNTVIPSANVVVGNTGTANPTLTITPGTNQFGVAEISVTLYDDDVDEPRSTTASLAVLVTPNTNVVAVDHFNYDGSGPIDTLSAGYWTKLSGIAGQMQVGSGAVSVNTLANTENMQAKFLGSPYNTSSGTVLYASYVINIPNTIPSSLPNKNGSYFTTFAANTNVTGYYECLVFAGTNGAAPGDYRVGITDSTNESPTSGASAGTPTMLNAVVYPMDLVPGTSYTVVTALTVSNGFCQLWINPTNYSSQSVTDNIPAVPLNNISDFELRESGASAGSVSISNLVIGLSFNSVFFPPVANPDVYAVTENTVSNVFNALTNDVSGGTLNIVSVSPTYGTATNNATNVFFTPEDDFVGTDTVAYTVTDNIGGTNSSIITITVTNIPPQANPDSYTVMENSASDVLSPLTNDVVETPGGNLSLASVSPDSNGSATISNGTNVLFTPNGGFTGIATIGYTVTDNIGGTNSSTITLTVSNGTPIPLSYNLSGGNLTFTWSDSSFSLQSATNVVGPYITITGATSGFSTNTTAAQMYFRLYHP